MALKEERKGLGKGRKTKLARRGEECVLHTYIYIYIYYSIYHIDRDGEERLSGVSCRVVLLCTSFSHAFPHDPITIASSIEVKWRQIKKEKSPV